MSAELYTGHGPEEETHGSTVKAAELLLSWEHANNFSATQQRWRSHKPEELTDGEHRQLFGRDANNLLHGVVQADIALYVGNKLRLSDEDMEFFSLLGLVHDIAECKSAGSIDGDKDWLAKDDEDEQAEINFMKHLLNNDEHFSILGEETIDRIIAAMEDAKQPTPQTRDGLLFDASERIGYLRTQLVVADKIPTEWVTDPSTEADAPYLNKLGEQSKLNLLSMRMEVIGVQISGLYNRHIHEGTGQPDIDKLIKQMLAEFAPDLWNSIKDLHTDESVADLYQFEVARFTTTNEKRGYSGEDALMRAEAAAMKIVDKFEQTHSILLSEINEIQ